MKLNKLIFFRQLQLNIDDGVSKPPIDFLEEPIRTQNTPPSNEQQPSNTVQTVEAEVVSEIEYTNKDESLAVGGDVEAQALEEAEEEEETVEERLRREITR